MNKPNIPETIKELFADSRFGQNILIVACANRRKT